MKTYTIKDIRELFPCYDPACYLSENWKGTVLDILNMEEVPQKDRIWVSVRLLPRHIVECFAVDCVFRACADAHADAAPADAIYSTYAAADAAAAAVAAYTASTYAAAYAAFDAAIYSADAAAAARKQERENQIDSLILLIVEDGKK